MRNRWTVEQQPVLAWVARVPAAGLPAWRDEVFAAGDDLGVHRIPFGSGAEATSRIAFADVGEVVVEDDIADLGQVLAAAPHTAPVRHRPPLQIAVTDGGGSISSCSDIWLPWCSARYEDDAEPEDLADNRELAARHTPRLNAFLTRVRAAALDLGGTWELDRDVTYRSLLFELDDDGVRLDAENPLERAEWNWVDGPSPDDLTDALRRARQILDLDPPPPPYRAVLRAIVEHPENPLYRAGRVALLAALRGSPRPLRAAELAGIAAVQIDNRAGRFGFGVREILGEVVSEVVG